VIKGYKGFNQDMTCRGFQFEIGGEHKEKEAIACESGFHFCEDAIDVFAYYPPGTSRYCEVEGSGKTDKHNQDSKVACTEIKIGAEVSLTDLISAGLKFRFSKVDWGNATEKATGDRGAASATGISGAASATGYSGAASATGISGAASATGYSGAASATGKHSVACGLGVECRAMGAIGCGIVLVEREWNGNEHEIKHIKAAKVDGKIIKANTWYRLVNGEFTEA
jgi:hypothetical protein